MLDPRLSPRDRAIIRAVHTFREVRSTHIERLFFWQGSPKIQGSSTRRTLRRLHQSQHIDRIEERSIGAWASGSHGYVYVPMGTNKKQRKPHVLSVTELYVQLKEAEREDRCKLVDYDCEAIVQGLNVIPDVALTLDRPTGRLEVFVEVDKGSESKSRITAKLIEYEKAREAWTKDYFPAVLFTADDETSLRMMRRAIGESPAASLFRVVLFDEAVTLLLS